MATTHLSGILETPDVPSTLNRTFTHEQVQANLAGLESEYPNHYTFLDRTGVNDKSFPNPFTGEDHTESVQNIREQGGMVVLIAGKLANALVRNGSIDDTQKDAVMHGAILHNSLKRFEIFMRTAHPELTTPYSPEWIAALKSTVVDENAILTPDEFVACVALRNAMGHSSLKDFVKMENGKVVLSEQALAKMIVHIASDMVGAQNDKIKKRKGELYSADIQISSFLDRAQYADFPDAYPFLWTEGLAVSKDGVQELKNIAEIVPREGVVVKSYFEWQNQVYQMICDSLKGQLDPQNGEDPVKYIVNLVNKGRVDGIKGGVRDDISETLKGQ